MARLVILAMALAAALLCLVIMDLSCLMVACRTPPRIEWNPSELWWIRGTVQLLSEFALLIVTPLSILARQYIKKPLFAAVSVGAAASTLSTAYAWQDEGVRSGLKIFHYAFPYFVAWSVYAYCVVRAWPKTPLTFHPLRWCLGTFAGLFFFRWLSAPRGIVEPIPVDLLAVAQETVLFALILFPVWLPAPLGTKWPRWSRMIGALMFVVAAIYPLSVLLVANSRSEASAWLLSAAAVLVGVAHVTLRTSGMPAAARERET